MTIKEAKEVMLLLDMHAEVSSTCVMVPIEVLRKIRRLVDKYHDEGYRCFKCGGLATAFTEGSSGCKGCGNVVHFCKCAENNEE